MRAFSLADAAAIYACCERATAHRHWVPSLQLQLFTQALRRLDAALGERRHDRYWRSTRRLLWRLWAGACSSPLPFYDGWLLPPSERQPLLHQLRASGSIYPAAARDALELHGRLEELLTVWENPLSTTAEHLLAGAVGEVGILVRDSRAIPAVERFLASRRCSRRWRVLSIAQLSGPERLGRLVVMGPMHWFPDGVLLSPRASAIDVLTPSFFRDRWTGRPSLEGTTDGGASLVTRQLEEAAGTALLECTEAESIDPEALASAIDWDAVATRVGASSGQGDAEDLSEARLLLLEGEMAVFLDASDNARALVVDLQEYDRHSGSSASVARVPTSEVEPGMFLVLRTGGGGDYILPVAERILGAHAGRVHATQREWKARFRRVVQHEGLLPVAVALLDRGSALANEGNVRNWMSERNIKPQRWADFLAIMRFIGLEDDAQASWKNARIIDLAHKRAGQTVRRLLIEQIPKADLTRLVQLGTMDFELGEAGGGGLTAYRVIATPSQRYTLPASRLGHPFDPEDEPWRA